MTRSPKLSGKTLAAGHGQGFRPHDRWLAPCRSLKFCRRFLFPFSFSALLLLMQSCQKEADSRANAAASNVPVTKITVAAAADLKYALDEIILEFEKSHPQIDIQASYGSSGNLYAQLSNKAPFDMFLAADLELARKLAQGGQAWEETLFPYAVGHLVLWVPQSSALDVEQLGIDVLKNPSIQKIAIANPQHAPYGRAAEAALKHFGVYEAVSERLVLGENVGQTLQFVESGAADVGIIARSLALTPAVRDKGKYWPIPTDAHPALEQGGVILKWASDRQACEKFRAFMQDAAGTAILRRYGFSSPEK